MVTNKRQPFTRFRLFASGATDWGKHLARSEPNLESSIEANEAEGAVLGLLARARPLSRYQILRFFQNSPARFQNVSKCVHVQAAIGIADPVEETRWLQEQADRFGFPNGIVAHCDLASPDADDQLLAVNDALGKLAAQDPIEAELVKLRYFVGFTVEEAATLLNISPRTARNYWAHARTWLYREIGVHDRES